MRRAALLVAAVLAAAGFVVAAPAEESPRGGYHHVRVVDFDGEIEPVLAAYAKRQALRAKADGVDCLVLRIDSPGGRVDLTLELADLLLGLPDTMHVVAWVPRRAYSGAAVVSLPCDEIVMGESAHFGDAQPITISAEGIKPVGEKMESPLRAKVRDYAEKNGYPPLLAEAMITADIEVLRVRSADGVDHFVDGKEFRAADLDSEILPGERKRDLVQIGTPVDAAGRLLTMTAKQAAEYGFLKRKFGDGRAHPKDEDELLEALAAKDAKVEKVAMSFSERASRTLLDFSGILGAIVMLALTLLIFQGPGVVTWVGAGALALMIAITMTADQMNGFPILLLIVGAALIFAEVYLIPGFGIVGILGIAVMAAGFLFLAAGVTIGDTEGLTSRTVRLFAWEFILTTIAGFSLLFFASRWLPTIGYGRRMMLGAPAPRAAGAAQPAVLAVGARGVTLSPLRPAGTAEFDGRLADVVSDGEFVEPGAEVQVLRTEGPTVFVRPVARTGGGAS